MKTGRQGDLELLQSRQPVIARSNRKLSFAYGAWLALCWRIFSCTTYLMRGWHESAQTSHGAGMQMMDWYTAGRRLKLLQ